MRDNATRRTRMAERKAARARKVWERSLAQDAFDHLIMTRKIS